MKNAKNRILRCISVILLAVLPFALIVTVGESLENPFKEDYTTALIDKYETLKSGNGGRIIFVGGSSLPFGLRCDLLEERLGRQVLDMGVYAAFGTSCMCEITLDGIKEGDIVILAPELSTETYSLYFNSRYLWQAICENKEIISLLSADERFSVWKNYIPFMMEKIRIYRTHPSTDGSVYARSSFNKYGDISVDRPCNIMANGMDGSSLISLEGLINNEFIDFVNKFNAQLAEKGAKLYFSFPPTNQKAVKFTGTESDDFSDEIELLLDCEVIGSPSEMTYDSKYFYNTNYHLNSTGAMLHTRTFCRLLSNVLELSDLKDIEIPEIDGKTETDTNLPQKDDNDIYFNFEKVGSVWYLKSVKEEYRAVVEELTLPVVYNGEAVTGIESGCFEGCVSLKKLTVTDRYCVFDSGIFSGCSKLSEIYIEFYSPGYTSIPQSGLFDGTSPKLKVYIKTGAVSKFLSDYSWRFYSKYFAEY